MAAQNAVITITDASSNGTGPFSASISINSGTAFVANGATLGTGLGDVINKTMERYRDVVAQTFNADSEN